MRRPFLPLTAAESWARQSPDYSASVQHILDAVFACIFTAFSPGPSPSSKVLDFWSQLGSSVDDLGKVSRQVLIGPHEPLLGMFPSMPSANHQHVPMPSIGSPPVTRPRPVQVPVEQPQPGITFEDFKLMAAASVQPKHFIEEHEPVELHVERVPEPAAVRGDGMRSSSGFGVTRSR